MADTTDQDSRVVAPDGSAARAADPRVRARGSVMTDVARLAGVSHQTVSRVLHDSPRVRAETRERVLAAMRDLDYRPNPVARALVTGRSRTLGVVFFDTSLYGPASTLLGIEQAAHDAGYFVSIVSVRSVDRASVHGALERLREQGVDGAIVIAARESAVHALDDLAPGLFVVAAEAGPDGGVPVVAVDQHAGAALATEHLLELGHETVWHVAGPADFLEAQDRVEGWRAALAVAGAPAPEPLAGDWSPRSGYEIGGRLADSGLPGAIFVANDQMALGLLRAFHERGIEVPRDCSVVGFDDVPEAAYYMPPLTTVRQDFAEVGRRSLHILVGHLRGESPPARVTVPPELVERASSAPPGVS